MRARWKPSCGAQYAARSVSTTRHRAMYATDASNYRQVPIGLVVPKDAEDVERALAACRKFGAPVFSRGGGTSLAGEACNAAVVMDFSKYMNAIVEIDWEGKQARVQPGCVNDDLRNKAEERHLTFGPDPATHNRNTFGGMIGNNSCGMHAQMAGKTEENVEELDIVTYDGLRMRVGATSDQELEAIIAAGGRRGEIYAQLKALRDKYADQIRERFPDIPRRVSGFPLDQLLPENGFNVARALVGTESTCVTVVEAIVRLVHSPPHRVLLMLRLSGPCHRRRSRAILRRASGRSRWKACPSRCSTIWNSKARPRPGARCFPTGRDG